MKKIVIATDSWKGCLNSQEAGEALRQGIRNIYPSCEVVLIPVADGGEGLLEALLPVFQGHAVTTRAHNPLMQPITTSYVISADGQTALIEMAQICGLTLISPDQRNPMKTTTFGLGELIREALEKGCRRFIIGIGGSATNDGGLGMLQALGVRVLDRHGKTLGQGGAILQEVADIDTSQLHPALSEATFTIACDVDNPFYGNRGATRVYASQKGATPAMIEELEKGMHSLAEVMARTNGQKIAQTPGAGAAGGIGGAFLAFTHARLTPGIELILKELQFSEQIKDADLIITGEGRADAQTSMGKVAYGVLQEGRKQNIPVVLICGAIEENPALYAAGFSGIFSISPGPTSLEQALRPDFARYNLQRLASQLCRLLESLKA